MKSKLLTIIMLLLTCTIMNVDARNNKDINNDYEIVSAGIADPQYYLVYVSTKVRKKKDIDWNTLKKSALHGVIFKGFVGGNGSPSQTPMLTSPSTDAISFCEDLVHSQSGNLTTSVGTLEVIKVGKAWKISGSVLVAKEQLRKIIEDAGIIQKLGL